MKKIAAISALDLESVGECMSEVQQLAVARLTFVRGHDGGLGAAALNHRAECGGRLAGHDFAAVTFQPLQEGGVVDEPVLHPLPLPRSEARRVGEQGVSTGRYQWASKH